jgi:hypothetical protein
MAVEGGGPWPLIPVFPWVESKEPVHCAGNDPVSSARAEGVDADRQLRVCGVERDPVAWRGMTMPNGKPTPLLLSRGFATRPRS